MREKGEWFRTTGDRVECFSFYFQFHPPILTSTRNDVITAIIIIIHVHGSPEVLAEVGG